MKRKPPSETGRGSARSNLANSALVYGRSRCDCDPSGLPQISALSLTVTGGPEAEAVPVSDLSGKS